MGVGFFLAIAAELGQQPSTAFGQQAGVIRMHALDLHIADQLVVYGFQTDDAGREHFPYVIAGTVNVFVAEHQQRALGRTGD